MIPRYSERDYLTALLNLLPLGTIWSGFRSGVAAGLFLVLARVYSRNNDRAANLITDLFPATTTAFMGEWEKTLGLPDSCTIGTPTQEERRAAIVAKLTDEGGSSVAYYMRLASLYGLTVTIEQFAPARAGILQAGQPCCGQAWAHAFRVALPQTEISNFRSGRSAAGEALRRWGGGYIECVLNTRRPAHTVLIFQYQRVNHGTAN